ncbi:MAG: hypothetical protein AUK47_04465 [Deltaproteobacteria bacterium CG2_30_63_29]|nr:MAG: hypothetical protein AUK47_04465 [Deltaproteobacteria bacterium CG2_30_63_29]PJB35527.1 MAG: hypothetical protein CO108_25585 [Deltaproteobacteria bacterium CG_4_9_14_3_um_filter_63_12]
MDPTPLYQAIQSEVEAARIASWLGIAIIAIVFVVALVGVSSTLRRKDLSKSRRTFVSLCYVAAFLAGLAAFGTAVFQSYSDPYVLRGRLEKRELGGSRESPTVVLRVEQARRLGEEGWGNDLPTEVGKRTCRVSQGLYDLLDIAVGEEVALVCLGTDECIGWVVNGEVVP